MNFYWFLHFLKTEIQGNQKFRAPESTEMAFFELLHSLNLISRKLGMTENADFSTLCQVSFHIFSAQIPWNQRVLYWTTLTVWKSTIKRDHAQKISVKLSLINYFRKNVDLTEKMFSVKIVTAFCDKYFSHYCAWAEVLSIYPIYLKNSCSFHEFFSKILNAT